MTNSNNIITFKSFSKIPGLIHGFSTREFSSMRPSHINSEKSLALFSKSLNIIPQNIIRMRQVHGDNIVWVNQHQKGQWIDQADGMITEEKNLYLSVLTADCLPIFIFDTAKKYLGVVHAGWRGIYNEILIKAINELVANGSNPVNLIVGIGPCIRSCCYSVDRERADMFTNKFPDKITPGVAGWNEMEAMTPQGWISFVKKRNDETFLDLVSVAKLQLKQVGIPPENIENCGICTSDNLDRLFSFRKEGDSFGKFIGIIGMSLKSKEDKPPGRWQP